ncbi:MFS transporter [Francisella sp. 19X1-34]|nr:MFS transporter [Francisella sp. 19X1-34]
MFRHEVIIELRFGISKTEANTLTSSFFAINFLFHFLGGTIGGRYLSFRGLFFVSLFLQFVGLCLIAIDTKAIVLMGMATFITGSGLNVSCINMMLTQLFDQNDKRRRIAFSVNYSFMNIGFVASFFIAGYLQGIGSYSTAFYFAAICLLIATIMHLSAWKYVNDKSTYFVETFSLLNKKFFVAPLIILACLIFAYILMHHPVFASYLIYVAFIAILIFMLIFAARQPHQYKLKIYVYLILSIASMVFACVQGLQSTALENFVEFNTTKSLFGIPMAPATVNMFESLGVIIFGFILAMSIKRRQRNNNPYQPGFLVVKGLAVYVIAFLMIPLGIFLAGGGKSNVIFPILLLIIVAMGEIHVNAVNYAMAGEMMDPKHQGLFTGYLFLNIAFGINLAGPISNYVIASTNSTTTVAYQTTNPMYMHIFLVMALVAFIIAAIFFFLIRFLNNILAETNSQKILESEII